MHTVMGSQVSTYVAYTTTVLGSSKGDTSASTQCNEKWNLIPGIPDDITVNHILTKLQWRQLYVLTSLSRVWQETLKSGDVYEARVRASSTQTLVAMIHDDPTHKYRNYVNALSLYDIIKNSWHLLPQIPSGLNGIPEECGCVSLLGKVYIIGGRGQRPLELRSEVHTFNLIGQPGWRQCASMKSGRAAFACGVNDGKIYVFGGMGAKGATEVYDPEQDMWQEIAPMLSTRMHHKVVNLGGKFYVQLGKILGRDHRRQDTQPAEVYDPHEDHWRKVQNFSFNTSARAVTAETMVVINGRVHKIMDDMLYVLDEPSHSWKGLQSISWDVFAGPGGNHVHRTLPFADAASALAVNGELLALVYGRTAEGYMELVPLKSQGLGLKNESLVWKRIECSLGFLHSHSMCTVDL